MSDRAHLLSESHHGYCSRPWSIGRDAFEFLVSQGLWRTERVLDFGCGPGRIGIHLIAYLDPGNYVGVDINGEALEDFSDYEIPLHGLAGKRPALTQDIASVAGDFSWVIDHYAMYHVGDKPRVWEQFRRLVMPGGRVAQAPPSCSGWAGFRLQSTHRVEHPSLDGTEFQAYTEWGIYR